ncbi:MAG TPA: ATP-binding cassette domain-containing protein [Caldithrix abyssi]|uniref:ATP-binding cassette domain-containing protein n=1 Tax=Caldithrix abyssi TaxID=187145 RepID=A0A7V4WV96_CALAY|nr:ATP-binding cassette domain-containing protein [Caldithrix abyssi]
MEEKLLEVQEVSKSFGEQQVIDKLSFRVKGGETFGLLGPNGAGKTTMMRMIMNIIRPDSGAILYNGEERRKIKGLHFGYLPEERGLYPRATVLEMLVYFGTLNNMARRKAEVEAIRYLDRLGMVEFTDSRVNQLSKGMQQKVQFVAAFLHDPDVLILDEPFAGLDPINQVVLQEILTEYKKKKRILIISTHQMEQAEKMCDHICLINQARVILDGRLSDLKKKYRENAYLIESDSPMDYLHEMKGIKILEEKNNAYKFAITDRSMTITSFFGLIKGKVKIRKFEIVEPSLHDIFIKMVQKESAGA